MRGNGNVKTSLVCMHVTTLLEGNTIETHHSLVGESARRVGRDRDVSAEEVEAFAARVEGPVEALGAADAGLVVQQ